MNRGEELGPAGATADDVDDDCHGCPSVPAALMASVDEQSPQEVSPRLLGIPGRHVERQHDELSRPIARVGGAIPGTPQAMMRPPPGTCRRTRRTRPAREQPRALERLPGCRR